MRLIDADELKIDYGFSWDDITPTHEEMIAVIERQPTIDAVPVVRCRECKHYTWADNRAFGFPVKRCEYTGFEDVDDDDFCSRGERRQG